MQQSTATLDAHSFNLPGTKLVWVGVVCRSVPGWCQRVQTAGGAKGHPHRWYAVWIASFEACCLIPSWLLHVSAATLPYRCKHAAAAQGCMALIDATTALSSAAVPTVCLGLLDHMEQQQLRLSSLRLLVVGGAACPRQVCGG